jgi:hypothetical protein
LLKLRAAPLLLLVLIACTTAQQQAPRSETIPQPSLAPVFFFDGDGMIAEYIELGEGEAPEQLFNALVAGPVRRDLTTELPADAELRGEFEQDETLFLDISESFWQGSVETERRRIAQVLYTMASLEEGRSVRLLAFEGATQPVRDLVAETLDRTDVADLRPWIHVIQPVAGSRVSTSMPVRVELRDSARARALILDASTGRRLDATDLLDGEALMRLSSATPQQVIVRVVSAGSAGRHHADLEVSFVAP